MSDAGRALFAQSRVQKKSVTDADRPRKYLARFELCWADVAGRGAAEMARGSRQAGAYGSLDAGAESRVR